MVEDNPHDRQALVRVLSRELGALVETCARAEEALELLLESPEGWQALVVDHRLPGMSGLELINRLVANQGPPAILLTGVGSESLAAESIKSGAADYVVKDGPAGYLKLLPLVLAEAVHRREAAERLREMDAQRKALIKSLPVGVIWLDRELEVTEMNPVAERLTGWTGDRAQGASCEEVLRATACGPDCPLRLALQKGTPQGPLETKIYNAQGEVVPVSLLAAGIFDDQGNWLGGVEIIQDLTDQKAHQQERAAFLSMLVHDMKPPLMTLHQQSRRLLENPATAQPEVFAMLRDQTEKLQQMVSDFLSASRRQKDWLTLNLRRADLSFLMRELVQSFTPQFSAAQVELKLDLPSKPVEISCDASRLRRALANLLDNACRYSPSQGVVEMTLMDDLHEVAITVEDQGPGLAEADLARLFQPFFRGGDSAGSSGYGLGLAGVKAIVEGHGGGITASNRPAGGACFRITLPVHQRPLPLL